MTIFYYRQHFFLPLRVVGFAMKRASAFLRAINVLVCVLCAAKSVIIPPAYEERMHDARVAMRDRGQHQV